MKPLKLFAGVAIIVVGAASLLVGCGSAASSGEPPNTDPRLGSVQLFDNRSFNKICDPNTDTLLYSHFGGGMAAIPNSPECQPN